MAYSVELAESAHSELGKLDAQHRKRILKFLYERVAKLDDPRSIGEALHGSQIMADLQNRRRPPNRAGPSCWASQGSLSLSALR